MREKKKLLRITTVPISLKILLQDQLHFMNQHFEVVGVSSAGDELKEVEQKEGIRVVELEMSREITPLQDFLSLIKMFFLLLRERPDIVHTHTPKAGIIGMLGAWVTRVPYRLHTVAGLPVMEATGKKKTLLLFIEKLTYLAATHVYPNSYGLEKYILQERLIQKSKLKVIGHGSSNGIDTDYFSRTEQVVKEAKELLKEYHLEESFVFCFVGRVVKDKGINELLYAFDKLSYKYNSVKLFIVGGFEEKLDPISDASKSILENNTSLFHVGFQNDIRPFLAASDFFVLPTYREGFPNVVLQASAMGLASIVTNINGCNEIITHNHNGLLVEPKEKEELFEAMQSVVEDQDLAKKLSLNSKSDIMQKYDRKVFHNYLFDEYKRILDA